MTRVELGSIVSRQKDSRAVLAGLQAALGTPVVVADSDGRVLLGNGDGVGLARHPVRHEGRQLGWVEGTASASAIAALLEHLIAREVERKALGAEVLHLYREINLIYSFSEKLAALLELDRLAQLTLRQARHLIVATDGVIMLMDEPSGVLSTLALFGDRFARIGSFQRGVGIVGTVAATGIAEVVDDIDTDPRRVVDGTGLRSLILRAAQGWRASHWRDCSRQYGAPWLYGGGAQAAQHACAANGDGHRKRAAVRAHD